MSSLGIALIMDHFSRLVSPFCLLHTYRHGFSGPFSCSCHLSASPLSI